MAANLHASVVVVADRGVLVRGVSGSGKSSLVVALLDAGRHASGFARLVADDQVFLSGHGGRLVAARPAALDGLVELRGHGIAVVPALRAAAIDLVVTLSEAASVARLPDERLTELAGCMLPELVLPERSTVTAVPAVLAALGLGSFA